MGGVEFAVPVGIALLIYFLFPAYLKNRQERMIERLRAMFESYYLKVGPADISVRLINFPAVIAVSKDYILVRNILALYADEIPYERLRQCYIEADAALVIKTIDHTYRLKFESSESASEWKAAIEASI